MKLTAKNVKNLMNQLLKVAGLPARVKRVCFLDKDVNVHRVIKQHKNYIYVGKNKTKTKSRLMQVVNKTIHNTFGCTFFNKKRNCLVTYSLPMTNKQLHDTIIHECCHIIIDDISCYEGKDERLRSRKDEQTVQALTKLMMYLKGKDNLI